MPLFSGIKANGASVGEIRENSRKIGMGLLVSFTAAQIALNQITMEDLSRVNAHTSYNQLVSQAAASKYVPLSGLSLPPRWQLAESLLLELQQWALQW